MRSGAGVRAHAWALRYTHAAGNVNGNRRGCPAVRCTTIAAWRTRAAGDSIAPWIDTAQCTACDECVNLNSSIFAYNENKKAYLKNPNGGPYKDIVKAAERCTARVIHPGLPKDRSAKGIDKWIKRGEKFN